MSTERIIIPEEKEPTEEEKEEMLKSAFRMDEPHAVIPPASNAPMPQVDEEDAKRFHPKDGVPVDMVPLVKAGHRYEHRVQNTPVEGGGDDVPPHLRK